MAALAEKVSLDALVGRNKRRHGRNLHSVFNKYMCSLCVLLFLFGDVGNFLDGSMVWQLGCIKADIMEEDASAGNQVFIFVVLLTLLF